MVEPVEEPVEMTRFRPNVVVGGAATVMRERRGHGVCTNDGEATVMCEQRHGDRDWEEDRSGFGHERQDRPAGRGEARSGEVKVA